MAVIGVAKKLISETRDKEFYLARDRKYSGRVRANARKIQAELKNRPCMDCGGRFPLEAMDFDHRPGEVKTRMLSRMYAYSESRIREEASKCDVVCANCHRIRTHLRGRNRRSDLPTSPFED